jgi:hypothetical protein
MARLTKLGLYVVVNGLDPFFAVILLFDGFHSAARSFVENLNIDGSALKRVLVK